jgi:hypothetical protein
MLQRARPFLSWQDLSRVIELEFGPSEFERPRASLFKLQQTGSVDDYYLEFTALTNRSTKKTTYITNTNHQTVDQPSPY